MSVIGAPKGLSGTFSEGVVSAKRVKSGYELFQLDAPISQGSSGGGVFDTDGKLIALVVGLIEDAQNVNFAVPINYARGLNLNGDVRRRFRDGLHLLESAGPKPSERSSATEIKQISSEEIFRMIEQQADATYNKNPTEGEVVVAERDMGNIVVVVNERDFGFYIFYATENIDLNEPFLKELLFINEGTSSVRVGIDRDDETLTIGYEGYRDGLTKPRLRALLEELIETDLKAVEAANGSTDEFSREDIAFASKLRGSTSVKLSNGAAEVRVPKILTKPEESVSDGATIFDFRPKGKSFPLIRIIAEPELQGLDLSAMPDLLQAIWDSEQGSNAKSSREVLASGTHEVAGYTFYWERARVKNTGITFYADYSVYSGSEGLIQFVAMDLAEDGEGLQLLDTILSQFKLR